MNTRDYKEFAPGEYYHIFNRGVGKIDIFKDDNDYFNFIKRLKLVLNWKDDKSPSLSEYSKNKKKQSQAKPLQIKPLPKNSFDIVCYCLMPNHFHLLVKQAGDISISVLISKLCTSYSMYFNRRYERVGSLFQDTFKAIHIPENNYLLWLSAYIHQNPAVAGLVWDLLRWKWSSYNDYVGEHFTFCNNHIILEQFKNGDAYRKFVESAFDDIKRRKSAEEPYFLD